MSFTFSTTIPAAQNNPSDDQRIMLQNNVATNGIIGVDHVSFNATNGGTHKQVTFSSENTPGSQTDPQSTLYTGAGISSTVAQMLYKNQNAAFPINFVKAWAYATSGGVDANQKFNVISVTRTSMGNYSVTLAANIVFSSTFGVLVTPAVSGTLPISWSYKITGTGTFNLIFAFNNAFTDPASFNFAVIQL